MDTITEKVIRLEEKNCDQEVRISKLEKTIDGNGKPGLKYDIIKMKNAIYFNNIITSIMTTALIGNLIKWLVL